MVCECLTQLAGWRALPAAERTEVFIAAVLHDLGKAERTKIDDAGHVQSPGHSRHGAIRARRLLWEMGLAFEARERVAALVRHHMKPFFTAEDPDLQRTVIRISQTARCDHLALLAEADARGRIAANSDQLLEEVALFADYCRALGCFTSPRAFPSDHSRFLYFRTDGRDPDYLAYDDTASQAVVLSGLPGAGKDHWLAQHPELGETIALDEIRAELGVRPGDDQRRVAAHAFEAARTILRQRRPLVWNATNLSRELRGRVVSLMAAYGARVRIVYVEAPPTALRARNLARSAPVPAGVVERLLDRWEVPDLTEAHEVSAVLTADR